MNRQEFLQRAALALVAVRSLDSESLQASFNEETTQVEIYREGALVTAGNIDETLKEYYLPVVKGQLNSDSVLLGELSGKEVRIPLLFPGDSTHGEARVKGVSSK